MRGKGAVITEILLAMAGKHPSDLLNQAAARGRRRAEEKDSLFLERYGQDHRMCDCRDGDGDCPRQYPRTR